MQCANRRNGNRKRFRRPREPRIGTLTLSSGPDAEERLRRLFNLAVRLATGDQERPIQRDPSMGGRGEEEV